jgi:hypothetical protein
VFQLENLLIGFYGCLIALLPLPTDSRQRDSGGSAGEPERNGGIDRSTAR